MSMTYFYNYYSNDNINSQANLLLVGSLCHLSDLVSARVTDVHPIAKLFVLQDMFIWKPYIITYI